MRHGPRHRSGTRVRRLRPQRRGGADDFVLTATTVAELDAAFRAGDTAARAAVRELEADGGSFERVYTSHPTAFLIHTVVHDAHHRGQVLASLRAAGRSRAWLEAIDDATWSVWRR